MKRSPWPRPDPARGANPESPLGLCVACVIAAGVLAGSCHRPKPTPVIRRPHLGAIEFQEASPVGKGAGSLNVTSIADSVRALLLASDLVERADPDAGAPPTVILRVKGRVGVELVEVEKKGLVRAAVRMAFSTRPSDGAGAINEELSAGGEQAYSVGPRLDRNALGQMLAERTAKDLVAGFVARLRLQTDSPAQIHAVITGDGGALREEAIRVVGARGLRGEVPTLLPLLQDSDESVRDAALGALIALREPRAVPELTRNLSLRDRHEMRKILEAIAILGGDEAREYLSFVAESHDDEEIRKLAADAQSRLNRHAPGLDR
jgi:hypothetical protein